MKGLETYSDTISSSTNPFPGLRSFDVWENYLFFGRDEQVDTLLGKLTDHRFVCVVGTSGSGKSSLVRAGLLPVLFGGFMTHAGSSWRVAVLRPGSDPIRNLAHALNADDVFGAADEAENLMRTAATEAILESSNLGLVQVVRQEQLPSDENLLVVIDQFEELFRFKESASSQSAHEAAHFVELVLQAVSQRDLPIYVVLTLRSDFLGDCAQYRDLPEAINEGQYLIPRLRREQLRLAVTGPIAVGGGKVAPRLVQQLLNDVGDSPDQLPILQHALMRTWDHWKEDHAEGEPIDLRHYEGIGGMALALSRHADEAYNELPDDRSRSIAEIMFKCLTERGADNRGIRRPTKLGTICQIAEADVADVVRVVDVFRRPGRSFVMPPYTVAIGMESTLDISHESLMRAWERLEKWVEEDAESARVYRRLVEGAALYNDGLAALWRDPELQLGVDWREEQQPNAAWALQYDPAFKSAMAFLDASVRARSLEESDRRRRRRFAQAVGALFVVSAGVLTAWALSERTSATENAAAAGRERMIAMQQSELARRQEKLAMQQKSNAEKNAQAAETQRLRAEAEFKEAQQQKHLAEQRQKEAQQQKQRAEDFGKQAIAARDVANAERATALAQKVIADRLRDDARASEQYVQKLRFRSIARTLAVKSVQLQKSGREELVSLLAVQSYLFNKASGGNLRDPDIYDALHGATMANGGDRAATLRGHTDGVRGVAYTSDGRRLITAGSDGRLLLWDTKAASKGSTTIANHGFVLRSVAISSDNKSVAYAGHNNTLRIVSIDKASEGAVEIGGFTGGISTLEYFDGGARIAALGLDGRIRVVNVAKRSIDSVLSLAGKITSMATIESEGTIVAGTGGGHVYLWDLSRRAAPIEYAGKGSSVGAIAISSDGQFLAAGSSDGAIRLWERHNPSGQPITYIGHRSAINALTFRDDGSLLGSASGDGTVRLWNTEYPDEAPVVIRDHDSWVWSVAFSPDGGSIASGGYDRLVRIDATSLQPLADGILQKLERNFTTKEWQQFVGDGVPYQKTNPKLQ